MKKLEKCWLVLVSTETILKRYQYWNDNKPVLKIPLVPTLIVLDFLNTNLRFTGIHPSVFIYINKRK